MEETMNSIAIDFANLLTKGTERIVDLQKKVLDTAVRYDAEAVETFKKITPCATGTSLLDLQGQAFEKYVAAQKSVLDAVQQQTAAFTESTKTSSDAVSKAMNNVADIFKRSLEQGLAVQQSVVDAASQQYTAMKSAVKS
jgi:hypothetical protein